MISCGGELPSSAHVRAWFNHRCILLGQRRNKWCSIISIAIEEGTSLWHQLVTPKWLHSVIWFNHIFRSDNNRRWPLSKHIFRVDVLAPTPIPTTWFAQISDQLHGQVDCKPSNAKQKKKKPSPSPTRLNESSQQRMELEHHLNKKDVPWMGFNSSILGGGMGGGRPMNGQPLVNCKQS